MLFAFSERGEDITYDLKKSVPFNRLNNIYFYEVIDPGSLVKTKIPSHSKS